MDFSLKYEGTAVASSKRRTKTYSRIWLPNTLPVDDEGTIWRYPTPRTRQSLWEFTNALGALSTDTQREFYLVSDELLDDLILEGGE